jgi:imidazolonepropionase-like amidohydrolase
MRTIRRTQTALFLILTAALGLSVRAQSGGEILIRNATILTASHGTIENGSILIRDGKIAAVGKEVTAGPRAKVIDATGMYVTPGFIDAHSHTASEDPAVNEMSYSVTSMVRMGDVVNDRDINIYRQLAGGTTTIHLMHGSANSIGGQNVVLKLKWGRPADELILKDAPRTIKFALGENPKRSGNSNSFNPGRPLRYPATRMGVAEVIREAFTQGRDYVRQWDEYEAAVKRGAKAIAPRRDLKLEAIADILRGQLLVHSHCYRADEILMLINVAAEFGVRIQTFQHVLEGYKVAREIAAHGAGGSTFSDWWDYKMEAWDAIPGNAAIMARNNVVTSVNSDSADLARRLYQEAAKTIKYGGLTEEEALRFVTLNPARQLKIDHRTGSIDVGKDADLAIFNAHPFSIYARVEKTLIEGEVYFDRQADLARREQLAKQKKDLIEREKRMGGGTQPAQPLPAPPPTITEDEIDHQHTPAEKRP